MNVGESLRKIGKVQSVYTAAMGTRMAGKDMALINRVSALKT